MCRYLFTLITGLLFSLPVLAASEEQSSDWWAWLAIVAVLVFVALGYRFVRSQVQNNVRVMAFMFASILRGRLQVMATRMEYCANLWHDYSVLDQTLDSPIDFCFGNEYEQKSTDFLNLSVQAELSLLGTRKLKQALTKWQELIAFSQTLNCKNNQLNSTQSLSRENAQKIARMLTQTADLFMQASFDAVCY